MLHCKYPGVFLSLAVLFSTITGCANTTFAEKLEESLQADSKLKDNPVVFGDKQVNTTPSPSAKTLPADFPKEIPVYPNAELQSVNPDTNNTGKISASWTSSDPSNSIVGFYRNQLRSNKWEVIKSPTDGQQGEFEAERNNSEIKIVVEPKNTTTELLIEYSPSSTNSQTTSTPNPSNTANPDFIGPLQPGNTATQPQINPQVTIESKEFNDLNKAPQELQSYIQDLATLGILSAPTDTNTNKNNNPTNQFQPNKNITRREYARWLVAANNAMHVNSSSKQIRLASASNKSAFRDVKNTDPDFAAIQGLAEAGLIPSSLSGDSTQVLFRPDAPLTREQMVLWKIPLDTRQALPNASLDTVKQTWGFQDVGKIDPKALRAVIADYQNGDQSNIRRVFGYTTLFQPKKAVNRAEAAAALWYFGTENEGISAKEALKLKQ
ncbi:S-layer domain-containing protein [Calothrix parasitica NIES-267]|uniref:S-layer domain-containing protein n=1 Tax=Calothrix parasitica NIES-267 TaxID=1973488 RepID=A0A1Z4M042_9CYAN|nr:S-layer domain-containing protein [Calothrix parasitica NIES-267]